MAMQPLPVPRSSSRGWVSPAFEQWSMTHSTSVSVSLRGISTSRVTVSGSEKNSFSPTRYAIGSWAAARLTNSRNFFRSC